MLKLYRYRFLCLLFGVILLLGGCKKLDERDGKTSTPLTLSPDEKWALDFFNEFVQRMDECNCPGGSLGIVKDSSIIFASGHGNLSVDTSAQVTSNTVFRIGSLSKTFAAVLSAKLVDEGHFKWDDRVVYHLPDFRLKDSLQTERILIRHLLSHSIGIPRHSYTNLIEYGKSIDVIYNEMHKVRILHEEGKMFAYQNAAYSFIEKIIEKYRPGLSYAEVLKNELLNPLDMYYASTSKEALLSAPEYAKPHRFNHAREEFQLRSINDKYYNSVSSGGINASILDMSKYLSFLSKQDPEIVSRDRLEELWKINIRTVEGRKYYKRWKGVKGTFYGMGFRVLKYHDKELIYHGGFVNGYRGELAIDPTSGMGVVVLMNGTCDYSKEVVDHFYTSYFDRFGRG